MPTQSFRFIVASDFHLEQPLGGIADVPEHLRALFLDAPFVAARKVFDAALAEDADFVLLAGDVLLASATGPRGPLFLVEQFERLAQRGISVYWAGGQVDAPDAWPEFMDLPGNVHLLPRGRVESYTIERNGEPIARLLGTSGDAGHAVRPNDFSPDPAGLYTIALAHGDADAAALQTRGIHLWTLGGRHNRGTVRETIHYCGSPQGRCPAESGIHGCTLAQVDEQRQPRTSLIPTDAARWLNERIAVDELTTQEDLESRLRERVHGLIESAPTTALLVSWSIAGAGPVLAQLRRGTLAAALMQSLREDYGRRSPPVWTIGLEVETTETLPPEWYEQETIRGDFLRAVRQLQMNPDEPLILDAFLSEQHLAGTLSAAATVHSGTARERILREAAALGVQLLSGEEDRA